jgi:hypothetical protein
MMYIAIVKSENFGYTSSCKTIENRIDLLKKNNVDINDCLINEIMAINSRSIKRAA